MSRTNSYYLTKVSQPNAGHKNANQESEIEREVICDANDIRAWIGWPDR